MDFTENSWKSIITLLINIFFWNVVHIPYLGCSIDWHQIFCSKLKIKVCLPENFYFTENSWKSIITPLITISCSSSILFPYLRCSIDWHQLYCSKVPIKVCLPKNLYFTENSWKSIITPLIHIFCSNFVRSPYLRCSIDWH